MAQAGSAQREPSMEEILASIRRIIEDNDTGRKPDTSAISSADPVDFEVERVANDMVEVETFRTELQVVPPARARPLSLAEVQAQVAEDAPAGDDFPILMAGNDAEPVARQRSDANEIPTPSEPVAAEAPGPAFEDSPAMAEQEPVRAEPPVSRPAIISEHAGRQVAAAFGELSEAFAARSKKTFDQMAEEMLRPMLQDWLDNNLPTLVERLVREEIERVARGAQ